MLTRYDPERAPDPARWLAGDEWHLTDIIERHHRREKIELPRPTAHALLHLIVENQIARGDELPTAETVRRLVRGGLSRHEAIHAAGWVVMEHMSQSLRENRPVDQEAFNRDMRALTEERWRAAFEKNDDEGEEDWGP